MGSKFDIFPANSRNTLKSRLYSFNSTNLYLPHHPNSNKSKMRESYHVGTTLTKEQWLDALTESTRANPTNIEILQIMYAFEGHKGTYSPIFVIKKLFYTSQKNELFAYSLAKMRSNQNEFA